jgi:MoaA/NifB/PqqE/SkfB family radical SAM enzyme
MSTGGGRFLIGFSRTFFFARVATHLALYYFARVVRGHFSLPEYFTILGRLIRFLKTLVNNKVVKIGNAYKMQLYLPAYPTPAFFKALEKFEPRKTPGPLTVVFSMTKACAYRCPHCYQRNDEGGELDEALMIQTAKDMQRHGTCFFNVEGGEPLLRFERLLNLCRRLGPTAEIWVNTTGYTLTPERVRQMKEAGVFGVMISLHSDKKEEYDAFTQFPGSYENALNAMKLFHEAGIGVAVNTVPNAEMVKGDKLEKLLVIAKENFADFVQIIHTKPSGAWLKSPEMVINQQTLVDAMKAIHIRMNNEGSFADYPSISAQVFEEDETEFGCTAGMVDRYYIGHTGEVQPCEFLNVSFGNVQKEPFDVIAARMRKRFAVPGCNWLCCTESASIAKAIEDYKIESTPIPWEITQKIMGEWKQGKPTPLYKDLGIYSKRNDS